MKRFTYLICIFITLCLISVLIGWAMVSGNIIVPMVSVFLGLFVIIACRRNVQEILDDERVDIIRSKAAFHTLEVLFFLCAILAVILLSFGISDSLVPSISGSVVINDDNTRSMIITYNSPDYGINSEKTQKNVMIKDIDSMNESEALTYCHYRNEAYFQNELKGVAGFIFASIIAIMVLVFGLFYYYYSKKL